MMQKSKRNREIVKNFDPDKLYSLEEAIEILKKCPPVKFDQSIEVSLKTGSDPRKAEQQIRGTVSMPHGTGKTVRVLAFAKGDKLKEAQDAGADFAGSEDLVEKVKGGWTDFDIVVVTPDMMREVGKLGKVLGPRGLMPTPKAGTVTNDLAKAIQEIKAGKIEYRIDKGGVINNLVGKLSFSNEQLIENISTLLTLLSKSKPASVKGNFFKSLSISSTMGPGLKIDLHSIEDI